MALSNAEKQRRYIARLKARAAAGSDAALHAELIRVKTELAQAKAELAKAAKRETPPQPKTESEAVAVLERQLKAARTQNANIQAKAKAAWKARDEAQARLHSVLAAIKRDGRKLRAAFHPDREPNASQERKAWQSAVSQTVNELLDDLVRAIEKATRS